MAGNRVQQNKFFASASDFQLLSQATSGLFLESVCQQKPLFGGTRAEMLSFCVHLNAAVLQPVVGGGKEMENDFWMERSAHFLPRQMQHQPLLHGAAVPGCLAVPWQQELSFGWEWVHISASHLLTSLLFFVVQRKMTSPVVIVALTVSLTKGPRREPVLRLRGSQKHSSRTGSALTLIPLYSSRQPADAWASRTLIKTNKAAVFSGTPLS